MRKRGGTNKGAFPGWVTPMTEPKLHRTDPFMEPDNAIGAPRGYNPMQWPIAAKTKGYSIGTGGVRNGGRWYKDGRKG